MSGAQGLVRNERAMSEAQYSAGSKRATVVCALKNCLVARGVFASQ